MARKRTVGQAASTEVDAYIYIRRKLEELGWNTRNPERNADGQVWTQNECLSNPYLKERLQQERPENIVKISEAALGTGGFLVAAFEEVKRTSSAELMEEFKRNSVFGLEQDDGIAALAIVNMIFRGDGKNNIEQANCLVQHVHPAKSADGVRSARFAGNPAGRARHKGTDESALFAQKGQGISLRVSCPQADGTGGIVVQHLAVFRHGQVRGIAHMAEEPA